MRIRHAIRQSLWKLGYDIGHFSPVSHPIARRRLMIHQYAIDAVLDVGANAGQYARELRSDLGYTKRILSFEPVKRSFALLERAARGDPNWQVFNIALGAVQARQEIHVAANSQSSSLLDMLPSHVAAAPRSETVGKELIEVDTLDSLFARLCRDCSNIYLKIDTQGFEMRVLEGARESLGAIDTIQMEMSLVPLYDGELLFYDMCQHMRDLGYTLVALENGFSAPATGQLLQVDGIFHRFDG